MSARAMAEGLTPRLGSARQVQGPDPEYGLKPRLGRAWTQRGSSPDDAGRLAPEAAGGFSGPGRRRARCGRRLAFASGWDPSRYQPRRATMIALLFVLLLAAALFGVGFAVQ